MSKKTIKNTLVLRNFSRINGFKKIIGLIGKENAEIITFKTRFGIHTFFLKFPIDVAILNKNNKVMLIKKSIKPRRFFFWNPKYDMVVEMPDGTIEKLNINIGSILKL